MNSLKRTKVSILCYNSDQFLALKAEFFFFFIKEHKMCMYRGNNNGSEVMKATKCQKD